MLETNFIDTEIGSLPADWQTKPLLNLVKDMADGPFGSNLKTEHYVSDKQVRIIQLSNIGDNGWHDENVKYTSFSHAATLARCIVPKGSILVAKMMPAGRAIICPSFDKQYILGSDVVRISCNEQMDSKYFVYFTKSDSYLDQVAISTQGSTRQRTSISKLKVIQVLLPPLPEQRRIASALTSIDGLISALDNLIRKKQAIKIGTMQELLSGKRRLEGFNKPWVNSRISDLYTVTRGYVLAMGNVRSIRSSAFPYPVYSSQTKNSGIAGYYSDYLYEDAITWTTDGANAGDMNFRKGLFYCTNVCGVLLSDSGMANYCMAKIIGLVSKSHVSYVGNPKLMNNTMSEIKIYHPSDVKEQLAISNLLQVMDDELAALEAKKAKYVALKQGMMQQLLTGKIRLIDSVLQNKQI